MAVGMYYNVEYTIQETTCAKSTEIGAAAQCPLMECEFAVSYFILSLILTSVFVVHVGNRRRNPSQLNTELFILVTYLLTAVN